MILVKQLWLNQNGGKDILSMRTSGDYITADYNLKMMDSPQHDTLKKAKRFRSAFTTDQVNYLEKQFKKFPYIGNAHRKEVALSLNIPERAVKIWFQNRRMKEKKDTSTKEFDNEPNGLITLEIAKDQLNSGSVPSPNDQPRSFPLLNDLLRAPCDNATITNNPTYGLVTEQLVELDNDNKAKIAADAPQHIVTTKVFHPPPVFVNSGHSNSNCKTSAEFSIDLCKKYETEPNSRPSHLEPALKKEGTKPNKNLQHTPMSPMEQIIPEDLSPNRKPIFSQILEQQAPLASPINNSGYVSLVPTVSPFYAQPYISASGLLWKPVSVLPVVSSTSSPIATSGSSLLDLPIQESVAKRTCNCDCHVKPQVSYNFQQQPPASPRYILTTLPFQNPSTKF